MIVGAVNACREAIVRLRIRGPQGQAEEIAGVVDTGALTGQTAETDAAR